jgi:DNA (cytosine-5)-methyltransferase 1
MCSGASDLRRPLLEAVRLRRRLAWRPMSRLTLMDLFSGCGGLTRGFLDSNRFKATYAVEMDENAAATYRANFGDHVFCGPIERVETFESVNVIIGGPPCQGFSPLNMRGVGLERRTLWREYLRALEEAEPDAFLMENVPQLLRSAEYEHFKRAAGEIGFEIVDGVLNAANFGVPQTRKRAIVIGSRLGLPSLPSGEFRPAGAASSRDKTWQTVRDAIGDLPGEPDGLNWHRARNPRPESVERYETIPGEGEGRFELAERRPDITPDCWLRKEKGSTDVFGRLWWDKPAYTIRTEFYKPEKGRYLHPGEHRPITVRDAARCMSFPDDFQLPEDQSMTSIAKQIGNAVPPLLALRLAESLADHIEAARANRQPSAGIAA